MEILSLGDNKLTGPIPEAVAKLPSIEILQLHRNQLTGTIPEFGNQASLEQIAIDQNGITGTISQSLFGLTTGNLKALHMRLNQLTGTIPSELGMLTTLEIVSMGDNLLTGDPAKLD